MMLALPGFPHLLLQSLSHVSGPFAEPTPVCPGLFCFVLPAQLRTGPSTAVVVPPLLKQEDHLSWLASSASSKAALEAVVCTLCRGMYCWFRPSLAGLSRSCSARLLSSWSWGYSSPDLGLCIFLSWTSWSTCQLQLVKAFLNGRTTIQCINYSLQLCIICKLAEGTLCPISQVMMLSSTGFSIDPRGTWLASAWTSCCWSQPFQPVVKQFSVHLTVH